MMKKNLFGVVAVFLLLGALSCATKSHWAGVYTGVIPSASGEGIEVKVTLNANETYREETRYIGKSDEIFTRTGKFTWNPEKTIITLDSRGGDYTPYYRVAADRLIHLDIEGNIITGDLFYDYVLKKQP